MVKRWALEFGLGFANLPLYQDPEVAAAIDAWGDVALEQQQAELAHAKQGLTPWWGTWDIYSREQIYQSWLTDPATARVAVLLAHVWREFPLAVILFLAGLQAIPDQIHEAASLDGAGRWARFRHVSLPLLRAPLLIVLVYQTITALAVFDLVYVMTGGGPGAATTLFSWFTYVSTFRFLNFGHGAALSFMIAVALLLFIILYLRILKPAEAL